MSLFNIVRKECIIADLQPNINEFSSDYELLEHHLITRLPKSCRFWTDKSSFDKRFESPTKRALDCGIWIEYNQSWVNTLIFDIDYKVSLDDAIDKCLELGIEPTWACTTTKGVHLAFTLEHRINYSSVKAVKFARDVKRSVTSALGADVKGSHRLKGIWRNPLQAKEFYFSNLLYGLSDFKHIIKQERTKFLSLEEKFDKEIKPRKVANKGFNVGNRNNFLWRTTMGLCKSTDFKEVLRTVRGLNNGIQRLDDAEVQKIARSVYKYNKLGKNNIGVNSKGVWNWNGWKKVNKTKEEILMTRQERARANAQKKEAETKIKILNFLNSFESLDCKKKNGSWNASKIAGFLNMKPHTVSKHLKILTKGNND